MEAGRAQLSGLSLSLIVGLRGGLSFKFQPQLVNQFSLPSPHHANQAHDGHITGEREEQPIPIVHCRIPSRRPGGSELAKVEPSLIIAQQTAPG